MNLNEEIMSIIAKVAKVPVNELNLDTQIYNSKIVTSLGLLELISALEKQYDIMLTPEELVEKNFSDIKTIVAFVERKMSSK